MQMANNDESGSCLSGHVALVTGGSRGIGASIARTFARAGCDIALCHLGDEVAAETIACNLRGLGRKVFCAPCDVADEEQVRHFVEEATGYLGPIDILVNNAGIGGQAPFEAMTTAVFDRMIAVHLRGTFLMTKECYPGMKALGSGRIINIASQLAYKGGSGVAHYCAAKAGIIGFTRALAREAAAHGVLVNAIAPGPIETDLIGEMSDEWRSSKLRELPIGRFAAPDEIAPTAFLLASSAGSFYVGQTLSPNGGDVMI